MNMEKAAYSGNLNPQHGWSVVEGCSGIITLFPQLLTLGLMFSIIFIILHVFMSFENQCVRRSTFNINDQSDTVLENMHIVTPSPSPAVVIKKTLRAVFFRFFARQLTNSAPRGAGLLK